MFVFRAMQSCRLRRIIPSVYLFLGDCDTPYSQPFWSRLAEICDRSDKTRGLTYVRIHMASIPLGTAQIVPVWLLRGARHEDPAAMEIDRWHGHPNMAKYETKDLVDLLHSCLIGR